MTENRRFQRWVLVALAALVLVSMGVSLGGDFVWDDRPLIVENTLIKNADRLDEILTSGFWESDDSHDRFRAFFRPVITLSYALDYAVWGLDPFGFHLTNLLLHLGCCLLVLRLALKEGLGPHAAFAAAAIFAVHPVHVESVAWISGRTDLLATLFFLAALLGHMRAGNSRLHRLGSWALFAAALFSKEMAATLPAIVFLWTLMHAPPRRRWRQAALASAPFLAILAVYFAARVAVLGAGGQSLYDLGPIAWVATTVFVVARYLTLLLLPVGLDAHYPYEPVASLFDPLALVGFAMVGLVLFAAWKLFRSRHRSLVWLAWIGLTLTPVLAFGRFGDVLLADRFLYLPSVGLALLAGFGVQALGVSETARRRLVATAALIVISLFCLLTVSRSRVWATDERLFTGMLKTSPHSALVHNNLGMALYHRSDLPAAVEHFATAAELAPSYALAHNNLAAAKHRSGQRAEALVHYREAQRLAPGLMMAGANGGHLLVEMGRVDEGLEMLYRTARTHPKAPPALFALASALHIAGEPRDAMRWLKRIREVQANYPDALYLSGKIHFEAGRVEQAAEALSRFLEGSPANGPREEYARRVLAQADGSLVSGN